MMMVDGLDDEHSRYKWLCSFGLFKCLKEEVRGHKIFIQVVERHIILSMMTLWLIESVKDLNVNDEKF